MRNQLTITNARLRGKNSDERFTIAVADERIERIERIEQQDGDAGAPEAQKNVEAGGPEAAGGPAPTAKLAAKDTQDSGETVDAAGMLVTEAFVNGHLHLDKVYTLDRLGDAAISNYHAADMGGAMTAIELAAAVKKEYDASWIVENVRRACDLAVTYGTATIRAFADVDTTGGLEGVKALLQAREEYAGRLELEVVAFPQDGVLRDPGAEELVEEALKLGADCVGGIPWIEFTDEEARSHVEKMVSLAAGYNKKISMLVDDAGDPNLRTLEMLAAEVLRKGLEGRATAQHARAMATYPEPTFRRLVPQLQRSQIGLVSDPHTGPLHARVEALLDAGIPVALGQDDISDAYYPLGRNNMLEVGFLAVHLLWMTRADQIEQVYDMLTWQAARVLGLEDRALAEGAVANLVVLDAENVTEALRNHERPRLVIHRGAVVSRR